MGRINVTSPFFADSNVQLWIYSWEGGLACTRMCCMATCHPDVYVLLLDSLCALVTSSKCCISPSRQNECMYNCPPTCMIATKLTWLVLG